LFCPEWGFFCLAHSETVGLGYDFYWSPEGAAFGLGFLSKKDVRNRMDAKARRTRKKKRACLGKLFFSFFCFFAPLRSLHSLR
jgi:hypothetical protein